MQSNYSFIKNLILLTVVVVVKPVIAGDANIAINKKNINQGYITISADDLSLLNKKVSKSGGFGVRNKKNNLSPITSTAKKKKVEVLRINSPGDAPVQVNKTESFVFKDITQRGNNRLSDTALSTRTAKIDSLRKQFKSR